MTSRIDQPHRAKDQPDLRPLPNRDQNARPERMQRGVPAARQRVQRSEEDEERLRRCRGDGDEEVGRGVGKEGDGGDDAVEGEGFGEEGGVGAVGRAGGGEVGEDG